MNYLTPLYDKLIESHINIVPKREGYYLIKISTVKADLVNYFKNKHRVLPAEKKNELIYNGDVEIAFNEIVKIFEIQGGAIFQANRIQSDINNDPFRSIMPNNHGTTSFGAPPKSKAKPRKPSRILQAASTKFLRNKLICPLKNKQKNNILIKILPNIIKMKFILIFPCKGIHPSPSNYEYLPSMHMSVTPCSLPINSHFREEQNLLNSHLPNGQEQQFATPSNNYTLSSNSFTNVNINQSSNGKTNGFEYYLPIIK
ncbi:unnamed protein product [Rhizophagus irregularis]|nr:unnamed protein product [Rhizophagus irregularis]